MFGVNKLEVTFTFLNLYKNAIMGTKAPYTSEATKRSAMETFITIILWDNVTSLSFGIYFRIPLRRVVISVIGHRVAKKLSWVSQCKDSQTIFCVNDTHLTLIVSILLHRTHLTLLVAKMMGMRINKYKV